MKKFLILFLPLVVLAQYSDRIVAIVDNEPVLLSDIEEVLNFYRLQMGGNLPPEQEKNIKDQILSEIIREKLLYMEARQDTNLKVTDEEIEEELDRKIEELKSQMGEENFKKELEREGFTVEELKKNYREDVRRNIFIQKYIAMYIQPRVMVSPEEVKRFYEDKKDSIPEREEGFYISHILIRILPDKSKIKEAKEKAENIHEKLKGGADFGYMAFKYSDDRQSALMGGEIGYVQRGILPPYVEEKIFTLKKGNFTEPIESDYGYYIFKIVDKKEGEVKLAQIAIAALPEKKDTLKALEKAREARAYALERGFDEAVQKYSEDFISKARNGNLGFVPAKGMEEGIRNSLKKLKEGEISEPVPGALGYHIFRLDKYQKGGRPSFEEIQGDMKNILLQRKMKKELDKVVEKIKKKVFVEVRDFED